MERAKSRAAEAAASRLERQSREGEARAKLQHMCDQAELARCRLQMSEFIGPLHRHQKQITNGIINWCKVRGYWPQIFAHFGSIMKSEPMYGTMFPSGLIELMAADPHGETATEYRKLVSKVLLPSVSASRKLILDRAGDLAEKPPESEWEEKYTAAQLQSPGAKATTHLSVLDNFALVCREWELVVEQWELGDYTQWQPHSLNPFLTNTLIDCMYSSVKKRESKFVKGVSEYRQSTVGAGAALGGGTYTLESAQQYFAAAGAAGTGDTIPNQVNASA